MIRYIFVMSLAVVSIALTVLIFALPTQPTVDAEAATEQSDNSFVIENIDIFDGKVLLKNQTLRIENQRIFEMGKDLRAHKNDRVVSGVGKTLLPGFIDAHTHTYGNGLNDAIRFGVTAHLDMFTSEDYLTDSRKNRDDKTLSDKTDLYSSGTLATVDGGHGTQFGFKIETIDEIKDIAQWVDKRVKAGADYIKLVYMPYQQYMPSLNREQAKEVIVQAKKRDLLVLAHISTQRAAKDMIEDGIDGLVHIFADSLVSDELLQLAKQNNIFITPTLAVIASADGKSLGKTLNENEDIAPYLSAQQQATISANFGFEAHGFDVEIAKQNVAKFHQAGVTILAGSDAPNPGTAYGVSAHHELQLLVESGLSEAEAIQAITSKPAQIFGLSDRGVIEQGARADFIILDNNPFDDISSTLAIDSIYRNGSLVERSLNKVTTAGAIIETSLLGDFDADNPLATIEDFLWSLSDDSMANGQSSATISVIKDEQSDSHALKVSAKVNAGFPYPWAGAALGDFTPPIDGVDISQYQSLVFDVKGSKGIYRVLSFDAGASGIPPSVNFSVDETWRTVTIPLSEFASFNTSVFSGFAFVAGPQTGEFEFMLDNVRLD